MHSLHGTLYLNVRKLSTINSTALAELAAFLRWVADVRQDLHIKVITTSVAAWNTPKFGLLADLRTNLSVEQYDQSFYPGQEITETSSIVIPTLRAQTRMTWHHERHILRRHGLREGMQIADICCGIGDFAALVWKEFNPARLVAIDHARQSLEYARHVAAEFGISAVEYVYGDAASLLLNDNEFDFVTRRHALQIFDRPDFILKELYRICKPGGIVYVTNEKNSFIFGEPRGDSIAWTYNEVARLCLHYGMDIEFGPKAYRYMIDAHFVDVRIEAWMVSTEDGNRQEFSDIIRAWETLFIDNLAARRGDSPEFLQRFRQGFEATSMPS